MTWIDLFVYVTGVWGITEFLRHDIRIREFAEYCREEDSSLGKFFHIVQNCGFCLAHWAAIIGLLLWVLPLGTYILVLFCGVRLSNLLNDIFAFITLTPNRNHDPRRTSETE